MIEIKNLSVRYGDFYALDHITLDIPRGSWTCLVGPNGAGKTTFLKTLLGNKAYDGSITIDGLEVYKNLRNVAFVPQRPEIPAGMDVAEYVMLGRARLDGWGRESRTSRRLVQQILEQMQLSAMRHQESPERTSYLTRTSPVAGSSFTFPILPSSPVGLLVTVGAGVEATEEDVTVVAAFWPMNQPPTKATSASAIATATAMELILRRPAAD